MHRLRLIILAAAALALGGATAPAGPGPGIGIVTHLPVPRFVSLRTDEVNFRAGPGFQYPVIWVYQRDGLPVEIIGEFDVWRHVVAPDGGTGWVHEATIRAHRDVYVTSPQASLRDAPTPDAAPVAFLNQGVDASLIACGADSDFCKIVARGITGYIARSDIWGVFADETVK